MKPSIYYVYTRACEEGTALLFLEDEDRTIEELVLLYSLTNDEEVGEAIDRMKGKR